MGGRDRLVTRPRHLAGYRLRNVRWVFSNRFERLLGYRRQSRRYHQRWRFESGYRFPFWQFMRRLQSQVRVFDTRVTRARFCITEHLHG